MKTILLASTICFALAGCANMTAIKALTMPPPPAAP